jgi:parallel beta-helix repeat protein
MNGKANLNIWLSVWVLVLLLAGRAAVGATIYVPADFNSIQAAIDAAANYVDEIEVAPGIYNEAINFNDKWVRLYSIGGPDVTTIDANGIAGAYHVVQCVSDMAPVLEGFTITGGNANGLVYPDDCGGGMYNKYSRPTVTNCIFTGNSAVYGGGGMYNEESRPNVTNCVFIGNVTTGAGGGMGNEYYNNESNPSVTDCNFINNTANQGGGMYNYESDPSVNNCTFRDNTANDGGGMCNYYSRPTVTNCTFSVNEADNGGGMLNDDSYPTVTNCTFSVNESSNGGGMLNQTNSNPTVTNCKFNKNEATKGGGMLNLSRSRPIVNHCIFSGNTASNSGGGMYNHDSRPTLRNCTFTTNTAFIGGGIFNHRDPSILTNCILWGDTPDEIFDIETSSDLDYCDIQGGWSGRGGNNIDADPCFVNVSSGDLRLSTPASPCVDAGESTILLNERIYLDLDGKHRYVDIDSVDDTGYGPLEFLDIGAYEFNCNYTAGDSNCDGVVDFKDLGILCNNWLSGAEPK